MARDRIEMWICRGCSTGILIQNIVEVDESGKVTGCTECKPHLTPIVAKET